MPTLEWIGKDKVINHHQEVPFRVLECRYSYDERGQWNDDNGSGNMIIHGDNLEALKSLLPRYEGRVKCIYIDPPYNTGKQKWVYNDNVNDPKIRKWLGEVVGNEGEDLTRHDKWLCMMYPRLKLLQRLLSDDGAIFISISDVELYHLKLCCDEIFGSNNFVEEFIWYIDGHTDKQEKITHVHEYIVCYAKKKAMLAFNSVVAPHVESTSKILNDFAENSITKNGSKNPPSIIELPVGFPCEIESLYKEKHPTVGQCMDEVQQTGYISREMTRKYSLSYPARIDNMIVENFRLFQPCRVYSGWMNNGKLKKFIANRCKPIDDDGTTLQFYLSKNGVVYYRREGRQNHYVQSVLEKMGTTETNKYMLESMGIQFEYPKPVFLIEFLLSLFSTEDSVILDSFAGSGTTAHAVLNMNKADGGSRKFILVEMEDYADSITAERIKRVIKGYGKGKNAVVGTGGGFSFYEVGPMLLTPDGNLNEDVDSQKIREYVYYTETKEPIPARTNPDEPYFLGLCRDAAYYFYYERESVTTLDYDFLSAIRTPAASYVIYADLCAIPPDTLKAYHITFKKIPRDIARL